MNGVKIGNVKVVKAKMFHKSVFHVCLHETRGR